MTDHSTHVDNSGPAFPACNEAWNNDTMGMSLRDWFAGQPAVTFEAACQCFGKLPENLDLNSDAERAAFFAVWAMLKVEMADAMLAARKGGAA